MATPKKFSIQQVFEILLRDPETKEIKAYLEDLKTSGLENTAEMVYPVGGRGNVYVGGGFSHSKRATLNVENATFNTEVMAIQNGTEVQTTGFNITKYEIVTVASNAATISETAAGTAGAEIGYAYIVNDDGTYSTKLTQDTAASTGKFSYAAKTITFSGLEDGTKVAVCYEYVPSEAQLISVTADGIPATTLVTAYGLAKDVCTGKLYPCQVDGMAQVDANYTLDLSADGDPAVHALKLEFVKSCTSKRLYDFKIYTDDEDTPASV